MGIPETYDRKRLNSLYRAIPLKDTTFRLLRKYFSAAANLYGIISLRKLYEIIEQVHPRFVTKNEFIEFAKVARHETEGYFILSDADIFQGGKQTPFLDYEVIDTTLLEIDINRYHYLKKVQFNKPYYIPSKKDFPLYANPFHFDVGDEVTAIKSFLKDYLKLEDQLEHVIYGMLFFGSRCLNVSFETLLSKMEESGVVINDPKDLETFSTLYSNFKDNSRMQSNRGYTPKEIEKLTAASAPQIARPSMPWSMQKLEENTLSDTTESTPPSATRRKVGRNEPCPCGSGKKFKRCCGLGQ